MSVYGVIVVGVGTKVNDISPLQIAIDGGVQVPALLRWDSALARMGHAAAGTASADVWARRRRGG